jgi:hypothetical protein
VGVDGIATLRETCALGGFMASLVDVLTDASKKADVVRDCLDIIDREVDDKSGLSGMAIKAGYRAVQGIKPGFVKNVVEDLLPEFAKAVDPIYQEGKAAGRPTVAHMEANAGRLADALLAITDGKAQRSKSGVVKATYERLRPTAKKNVEQSIPRLARLVEKYAG